MQVPLDVESSELSMDMANVFLFTFVMLGEHLSTPNDVREQSNCHLTTIIFCFVVLDATEFIITLYNNSDIYLQNLFSI